MMKIFSSVLIFLICSLGMAQETRLSLDWKEITKKSSGQLYNPSLLTQNDDGVWEYTLQWSINQYVPESSVRIENIVYEPIPSSELSKLDKKSITSELFYSLKTGQARSSYYAILNVAPFVLENGQYKRLKSAVVKYAFAKAPNNRSSLAITNSVLASGDYYKFYVEETGVHQLTRNFIQSMGLSLDGVDPQTIKVYGLGGSPLPLRNSDNGAEVFDLREIPIQVVGGEDGTFNGNDHVLFFGESSRKFHEELDTNINPYSDRSYYYITAGGNEGLRVQPMVQPGAAATTTFTTFDDYQFHEEDLESLVLVGRRWFGEAFNVENEQSFEFTFPNVVTNQAANLRVLLGAISESQTTFDISINGASLGTAILLPINNIALATGRQFAIEVPITSPDVTVTITYNNNGNPSSIGYLDFISLDVPRSLTGTGEQINFRNNESATLSGLGEYVFGNANEYTQIWDVTDQTSITTTVNEGNQGTVSFKTPLGTLRQFVAVTPSDYFAPFRESNNTRVANQDLKGTIFQNANGDFEDIDYLMITGDALRTQAERLAQHNRSFRGLNVKVVTLDEIYEEFGGGSQDIGAIRNFVKYVYDNASSEANRLQFLCMFGDASVDYKDRLPGNNNIMPTFQTFQSFSLAFSFMSDDFFGFMDPDEGRVIGSDKLDIAVGRILADTPSLAQTVVDKIINYDARESYGRWRNNFVLISDDVDEAFEFNDLQGTLDVLGDEIENQRPSVNVTKIHSDAFQQESSAGGDRYPQVNETISNSLEIGSLVVTYLGHGGEELLASETIITQNEIDDLANDERLPLLITVTCEFTKFDNPLRPTGGEGFIWSEDGGVVGMVATTREIFVSLGVTFNEILAEEIFGFDGREIVSVGENVRISKNILNDPLRRVVFFLGDPAMKLAFPKPDIRLTAINDIPVGPDLPTLRALDRVKVNGIVTSELGQLLSNYTGTLAVTLYDKDVNRQTLGNDGVEIGGELAILDFKTLGAILYRGQASVVNGQFEFEFVMPRDTAIPFGNGRMNFYSERLGILEDQAGVNRDIIIGGLNEDAPPDNLGPRIRLFMNDESFVNGGITDDSPIILAKLEDENGINTAGGIGHDILAILDGDETNPLVMNDFYETEVDDFTRGTASRRLRDLEEGLHTLTFIAWDVYNNSSRAELQFVVVGDEELQLENVLNYPNPFVNYTEFWFNHNRAFEPLDVQVQIFTVSGKVVKTINQTVVTEGFLSRDIVWDGLDDFGEAIGKGVYVYKITVKSTLTNKRVEKFEKLVIL
ncbi:type IX secretion system sortase PorU [Dokdonia sp.]|uniref:type IX secretion system sortase PorU n=1 Tax=Dokdonia sp. TaxID=2024995 RepID=UPI003263596B